MVESRNYPCNKEVVIPHHVYDPVELDLMLHKVRCGSTWCPKCFKTAGKKRIQDRLSIFEWEFTRHIMLSLDRKQFKSAEEGYKFVNEKHLISNMIWNLKRVKGIKVINWMWVLEWHEDNYPHWHLFIEIDQKGKAGMIGGDVLRRYWPWGRWVTENPIWSEEHWKNLTGYFDKHGYFGKEKGVQSTLPEWASKLNSRIRRYGAMILPRVDEDKKIKNNTFPRMRNREKRPYWVILQECGKKTKVTVKNWQISVESIVDVDYNEFRDRLEGVYVEGVGYLAKVDQGALFMLVEDFPGLFPLVTEILAKEDIFYDWIWDDKGRERIFQARN